MTDANLVARWQFAFTIMFHYLFPVLTIGLGVLIAVLKTIELKSGDREYGRAARFWARIFAVTFATGVVTGIPLDTTSENVRTCCSRSRMAATSSCSESPARDCCGLQRYELSAGRP